MNYSLEIDKLINAGIDTVKKTPELRQLLYRIYGDLFLSSGTPASCGSKDNMYFTKVCTEGKKKAQKYDSVANRTLVFRSNGKIFLKKAGVTFNFNLIDDEKAIEMLNKGWISTQAFIKMPSGYHFDKSIEKWVKDEVSDEELLEFVKLCKDCHKSSDVITEEQPEAEKDEVIETETATLNEEPAEAPDETEAPEVEFTAASTDEEKTAKMRMKELVDEGLSCSQIAETLNNEGYRTDKGNEWNTSSVGAVKRFIA